MAAFITNNCAWLEALTWSCWAFSIMGLLVGRKHPKPTENKGVRMKTFQMTFNGCPITLVASKYENDGTWQRYVDDRGIEILRIPASWITDSNREDK